MYVKPFPPSVDDSVRTMTDIAAVPLGWQSHVNAATVLGAMTERDIERDKEIGGRVKALREQRGWNPDDLAYKSKVSRKTIERIEAGKVQGRRTTISALAHALEVDEYMIIGEPTSPAGVPLSEQVEGVERWAREAVQEIIDRDTADRALIYRKLERLELMVEALMRHAGIKLPDADGDDSPRDLEAVLADLAREVRPEAGIAAPPRPTAPRTPARRPAET